MDDLNTRFLNYLFSNKHLTREQRREISQLLVRDIPNDIDQSPIVVNQEDNAIPEARLHDLRPVFDFLHLFTEKEALKYTTHIWDTKIYKNYSDFKNRYEKILNKYKKDFKIYQYNEELWKLISNFLQNYDANEDYVWSKYDITIGYNKHVEDWMNKHPNEQPIAMPLDKFPANLRPGPIERRTLSTFGDVVNIFKSCIEFRDNDLYVMALRLFKKKGFNINMEKLETLKGKVFYTYTENIERALVQIQGNIYSRKDFPEIEISCQIKPGNQRDAIILEILQVGSFSNRSITDEKVLGLEKNGTISTIVDLLTNLCDYSVESKFTDKDGGIKAFRIDYLVSDSSKLLYHEIPESDCKGYKTILTFYTYKKNEKNNNN